MANSQRNKTFHIATTNANTDLTESQFDALTWVEVRGVGSVGETGLVTNIITYQTLATAVDQKAKGFSNAGDPDIECERIATDPGQILMRAAGRVSDTNARAFKLVFQDGSIQYLRGLVNGVRRPGGNGEAFELEVYQLSLVQEEIIVDPPT